MATQQQAPTKKYPPMVQKKWDTGPKVTTSPSGLQPAAGTANANYTLPPQGPQGQMAPTPNYGASAPTSPDSYGGTANNTAALQQQLQALQNQGYGARTSQVNQNLANQLWAVSHGQQWGNEDLQTTISRLQQQTGWSQQDLAKTIARLQQQTGFRQQDLQTTIARLQQQTGFKQADTAEQEQRLRDQAKIDLQSMENAQGASGTFSGALAKGESIYNTHLGQNISDLEKSLYRYGLGNQQQVEDAIKQAYRYGLGNQQQVEDATTQAYRYGLGNQQQVQDATKQNARANEQYAQTRQEDQQAAQNELDAINRSSQDAKIRGELSSQSQAAGSQKTEAVAWVNARVRQLLNIGMDVTTARATAISEAREHWSNVDPTFIEGAFAPPSSTSSSDPSQKLADWSTGRYGAPITSTRQFSQERVDQIHKLKQYDGMTSIMNQYMHAAGQNATARGFLEYAEKQNEAHVFTKLRADSANAAKSDGELRGMAAAQTRAYFSQWAEGLSLVIEEAGLS